MQQQIFTAQVLDDRSGDDQSGQTNPKDSSGDQDNPPKLDGGPNEGQDDLPKPNNGPDGSQYEDNTASYEEYDSYAMPSDNEELEYMQVMHEDKSGANPVPTVIAASIWQPKCDQIKQHYQHANWLYNNVLEFTLWCGVTHIHNCKLCSKFKEHLLQVELFESDTSSAWKMHDKYEQDLIQLGWTLAYEDDEPFTEGKHELSLHKLNEIFEGHNHQLIMQLEASCRQSNSTMAQCKELIEALENEHLNVLLCAGEVDYFQRQYKLLQGKLNALEGWLIDSGPSKQLSKDKDIIGQHYRLPRTR